MKLMKELVFETEVSSIRKSDEKIAPSNDVLSMQLLKDSGKEHVIDYMKIEYNNHRFVSVASPEYNSFSKESSDMYSYTPYFKRIKEYVMDTHDDTICTIIMKGTFDIGLNGRLSLCIKRDPGQRIVGGKSCVIIELNFFENSSKTPLYTTSNSFVIDPDSILW